jgi:hypothetical protein
MMIQWNTVTWYSRILSIIVFVGIMPAVNFYIGVQYEQTQAALQAAEDAQERQLTTPVHHKEPVKTTTTLEESALNN